MRENAREAHHHRRGQIAGFEALHHFVQIDFLADYLIRAHHHVTGVIDAEVTLAPGVDMIEIGGIFDAPWLRHGGFHFG